MAFGIWFWGVCTALVAWGLVRRHGRVDGLGRTVGLQRVADIDQVVSGKPLSSFHTRAGKDAAQGLISPGGFFSLEPQDRAWLHARIAQRFDAMLSAGFIDEQCRVRAASSWSTGRPAIPRPGGSPRSDAQQQLLQAAMSVVAAANQARNG